MVDDNDVQLNTDVMDKLIRAFGAQMPVARIGILGKAAARTDGVKTNAEVGAAHEFGTSAVPRRSFLRLPLTMKLNEEIERAGGYDNTALAQVIKDRSIKTWMKKVAALAERIVLEAFATDGFGQWPRWKAAYKSKTGSMLQDTTQLRNSISSEVK